MDKKQIKIRWSIEAEPIEWAGINDGCRDFAKDSAGKWWRIIQGYGFPWFIPVLPVMDDRITKLNLATS